MNRQELIEAIAARLGCTQKTAGDFLEATIAEITTELKTGQNVTITGFGTFRISRRKARSGVLPRDPTVRIEIPAVNVPAFTAGKTFKDALQAK